MTASRLSSSLILATFVAAASAQVVLAPAVPQIGSSNPVSPEPPVARPKVGACVVPLLYHQAFGDFSAKPLAYTPPAACPGPWAKVVLTADFTVTAGRQYDRTASFFLGNANIFYGTTAEPRRGLSPSWHIERDLTDLSALFKSPQTGLAHIDNLYNSTYNGLIYANATLLFYPATAKSLAPTVPDVVLPLTTGNGATGLNTTTDKLAATITAPRNVERAFLDVIAQSQSGDEFWYLNAPNDQANALETGGNTAFRETEIAIDGKPAGVAPVYPWIYTGGIDPYLWEPIVGVQTLNFKPYRVDLTPFAALLSDGHPHTVSVSVYNADSYFLATGNLLLYTDKGRTQIQGGLVRNTLSAPVPIITENLSVDAFGATTGTVAVASKRTFDIEGYVNTSHGQVLTTLHQTVNFSNSQQVNVNANAGVPDVQNVTQTSTVDSLTTTQTGSTIALDLKHVFYPLTLNYSFLGNSDGTYTQTVSSDQKDLLTEVQTTNGALAYQRNIAEEVNSADTLHYNASFGLTAPGTGSATAFYHSSDSKGVCYNSTLAAANQLLTAASTSTTCQ